MSTVLWILLGAFCIYSWVQRFREESAQDDAWKRAEAMRRANELMKKNAEAVADPIYMSYRSAPIAPPTPAPQSEELDARFARWLNRWLLR